MYSGLIEFITYFRTCLDAILAQVTVIRRSRQRFSKGVVPVLDTFALSRSATEVIRVVHTHLIPSTYFIVSFKLNS